MLKLDFFFRIIQLSIFFLFFELRFVGSYRSLFANYLNFPNIRNIQSGISRTRFAKRPNQFFSIAVQSSVIIRCAFGNVRSELATGLLGPGTHISRIRRVANCYEPNGRACRAASLSKLSGYRLRNN